MKKHLIIVLSLILLAPLIGCSQMTEIVTTTTASTPTTTIPYNSYFPLIVGRVISYEVIGHSLTHETVTNQPVTTETTTEEIWQYAGPVSLTSTIEVFKINVISGGNVTPYYYREDNTGVYKYGSGPSPTTEGKIWIKYPLEVGATWEAGYIWWPHSVLTRESIITRAGTFDCKETDLKNIPGSWDYEWFAQGIGLIKEYSGYAGAGNNWTSREVISKNF